MKARSPSTCKACDTKIAAGDEIIKSMLMGWIHESCAETTNQCTGTLTRSGERCKVFVEAPATRCRYHL